MPFVRTRPADRRGTALFPASTITATKDGGNPTFAFDAIPESVIKVGSVYWCAIQAGWGAVVTIGLAYATDRDGPWTAYTGNPILTFGDITWAPGTADGIYAAEITEWRGRFWLFYSIVNTSTGADGHIGVAVADEITGPYVDHGSAILSPGTSGAWDSLRVGEPSVLVESDRLIMAFMAETDAAAFGASEKVGIATATDPTGPWTKAAGNPVIGFGASTEWDDSLVADPYLFFANGHYWIWYSGGGNDDGTGTRPWSCGLAYATDPTGEWTKHDDNPILEHGGGGAFDEKAAWRGSIFLEDGLLTGVYGGLNSGLGTARGGSFRLSVTAPESGGGGSSTSTSHVPVANGDPDAPAYLFTPDGSGLFVEVTL